MSTASLLSQLFAWWQGYGVYKFADKYGANVDGYSPIYTPDTWSESGETYKLGFAGLAAW
jgi:photosystem II protein